MTTDGDRLITNLEELRRTLLALSEKLNDSGVERTFQLKRIMGDDCKWYKKSMDKFLQEDYEKIHELVSKTMECFNTVEGKK